VKVNIAILGAQNMMLLSAKSMILPNESDYANEAIRHPIFVLLLSI